MQNNNFIIWPGYPQQRRVPADFNGLTYEWLNPEVSRSGLSPRKHYLMFGKEKDLPYRTKKWELDCFSNKYKTDKGSMYYNAHAYASVYEHYLKSNKDQPIRLLELGILRHDIQARNLNGKYDEAPSLFMWREYFVHPDAEIIGCYIKDFSKVSLPSGCKIIRGDVSKPGDLLSLVESFDGGFDIIIDDASHASHHQQIALGILFPFLKKGDYYFIEDFCYQPPQFELQDVMKTKTILEMLSNGKHPRSQFITSKQLRYLARDIATIEFYDSFDRNFDNLYSDSLAVIHKRQLNNY